MLTAVERVLILQNIDLLREVGPRHLLGLTDVAREVAIWNGQTIYQETDPADALYVVVEGRVRLTAGDAVAEVGPGEAFGTWALVDDAERGQRAECIEDGLVLALNRDEFYDVAADDLTLLMELLRVLAKRLRSLVAQRPEEARVEGEGIDPSPTPAPLPEPTVVPAAGETAETPSGRTLAADALQRSKEDTIDDERARDR